MKSLRNLDDKRPSLQEEILSEEKVHQEHTCLLARSHFSSTIPPPSILFVFAFQDRVEGLGSLGLRRAREEEEEEVLPSGVGRQAHSLLPTGAVSSALRHALMLILRACFARMRIARGTLLCWVLYVGGHSAIEGDIFTFPSI